MANGLTAAQEFAQECSGYSCGTVLADPPWQFSNRTGKVAPEHKRLSRMALSAELDVFGA